MRVFFARVAYGENRRRLRVLDLEWRYVARAADSFAAKKGQGTIFVDLLG